MKPFHVRGTERAVQIVRLNFDGDLFFQGCQDGYINCWITETGERLGNFKTSAAVKCLDVTDNTEYLVSSSLEGTVDLFKVQGGIYLGSLKTVGRKARYVEFSFGDQMLLIVYQPMGFGDYEISIISVAELLQACGQLKDGLEKWDRKKQEDKERSDKDKPFVDLQSLKQIKQWSFNNFKASQASWNFLNKSIVVSSTDGELAMIDFETGCQYLFKVIKGKFLQRIKAHEGEIKNFVISRDFSLLATAANDGCKVFDPETLQVIRYFKYEVPMNAVGISPLVNADKNSKPHIIVAGGIPAREIARTKFQGFDIHLCNIVYEEEVGKFLNPSQIGPINSIDFFPDGRGFVTGEEGGYSRVYKFDTSYWDNEIFQ